MTFSLTDYFVFCVVGRIIIFVLQKASPSYLSLMKPENKLRGFLSELFGCDLCLGVWIYTLGAWVLNVNVLYEYVYNPIWSGTTTGIITSFLVWLIMTGIATRFQIVWVQPQE
jgi:hypothetical protein